MKKLVRSVLIAFVLLMVLLSGCSPAPALVATTIPSPATPSPMPPTLTPEPTFTPKPSPTPIILSDVIHQTFSGASIEYRESFDYTTDGLLPEGWKCDDKSAAVVTTTSQLEIKPNDTGDWSAAILHFSKEKMTPNKAAYFTFMYTGDKEGFTLGFDAIRDDGQLIINGQKGFYSVAMSQISGEGLSAHIIQDTFKGDGYFKGDLKLQENTWYDVALGFDDQENYIIKIWDPNDLGEQLTYIRNWKDFPKAYYFISWISAKRSLSIDNFTIFEFDSILQ